MKVWLVSVVVCAALAGTTQVAHAQNIGEGSDKSTVFFELGGNGLYYSINYEMRLHRRIAARAGFSFFNVTLEGVNMGADEQVGVALIPVMANTFVGGGDHQLEIGAGPLITLAGTGVDRVRYRGASIETGIMKITGYTSALGYRYQRRQGGLMLRATLTPFYSDGEAQLWGGLSMGLSH